MGLPALWFLCKVLKGEHSPFPLPVLPVWASGTYPEGLGQLQLLLPLQTAPQVAGGFKQHHVSPQTDQYRHTNICIHSQTQKHVHIHTLTCHTCTWNYRHTNVYTHTHKRVDTYACAYTHINMHACGHVHPICKYIHMHKHITKNTWHVHIHTYMCAHANTYAHKSYT